MDNDEYVSILKISSNGDDDFVGWETSSGFFSCLAGCLGWLVLEG